MPELPEVETIKRGLEPFLLGQRVVMVDLRRADLRFPFPRRFAARLEGQEISGLRRRAKYLIADLNGGESLIIHLGMSGRFVIEPGGDPSHHATLGAYVYDTARDSKHDHVIFQISGGTTLAYNDPRRFGFMDIAATDQLERHKLFHHLGVEPNGNQLSAAYLADRAQNRQANLKAFLMDQRHVAGLGNIYVCEALHHAGLSPNRRAGSLVSRAGKPGRRVEKLVTAIRYVIDQAIHYGGSTLRDYRAPSGAKGGFQEAFAVYNRIGQPCVRQGCSGVVKRSVHQGRATFYCTRCQR